jgi:hypothetical protein
MDHEADRAIVVAGFVVQDSEFQRRFHGNRVKTLTVRRARGCRVNKSALGCEA